MKKSVNNGNMSNVYGLGFAIITLDFVVHASLTIFIYVCIYTQSGITSKYNTGIRLFQSQCHHSPSSLLLCCSLCTYTYFRCITVVFVVILASAACLLKDLSIKYKVRRYVPCPMTEINCEIAAHLER